MRINSLPPEVQQRLRTASPDELRTVAARCARLAVEQAALDDADVREAIALAVERAPDPVARERLRSALTETVRRLDEIGFDLYDRADEAGELKSTEFQRAYGVAFGRARAANAALLAIDEDPLVAAAEAAYEAIVGVGVAAERVTSLGGAK